MSHLPCLLVAALLAATQASYDWQSVKYASDFNSMGTCDGSLTCKSESNNEDCNCDVSCGNECKMCSSTGALTADAACLAALFCCPDVVIGCDGALDDFCTFAPAAVPTDSPTPVPTDSPTPVPLTITPTMRPSSDSCIDGIRDTDETDIDCGGHCRGCEINQACLVDHDCYSSSCVEMPHLPRLLIATQAAQAVQYTSDFNPTGTCDGSLTCKSESNNEDCNCDVSCGNECKTCSSTGVLTADAACLAALFCCPDVVIGCDGALDDFCTVERRCAGQSTSTPAAEPVSTPADHDHHDHTIITIEINNIIIAYALLGLAAAAFLVCFCASASLCCFAHRSPRNICCKQSAKKAKKVAVEGLEGDPPPLLVLNL
jgi:hypothetical protein